MSCELPTRSSHSMQNMNVISFVYSLLMKKSGSAGSVSASPLPVMSQRALTPHRDLRLVANYSNLQQECDKVKEDGTIE